MPIQRIFNNPSSSIILAFLLADILGAVLLVCPVSTHQGITFTDALFTSTSALCVTGLSVQDTGTCFTFFGQCVILCLIQMGGMGILTLSAFFIKMVTGRLSFNAKSWLEESLTQEYVTDFYAFLKRIFLFVLVAEGIGSVSLFFVFIQNHPWKQSVFLSIFHSISAFCNAGFSLFPDSLVQYRNNFSLNLIIALLIIAGGLGFVVINEVHDRCRNKKKSFCFNSRIVLWTTGLLLLGGTALMFLLESGNALAKFSLPEKIMTCAFQSVTCRTAGFNTLPLTDLSPATLFLFMFLMFVGGSPGSTAGGIKTTSFAMLVLLISSRLSGRARPEIFGRTIARKDMERILMLLLVALLLIVGSVFLLLVTERGSEYGKANENGFLAIFFEVVSALGTVGLSMGITPCLTEMGKTIVIVLMFVGRIGPLTLAIFLTGITEELDYDYPEEKVMIG